MYDLAVLNGTLVSDGGQSQADLGISGDRIVAVSPHGTLGPARRVIDAAGQYVLPGAIDIHFHCRAPSHPERGDFASETRAAAAGGVTTVFEMPISEPACSTPEVLRSRRALGERECRVNFGLYAGGGLDDPERARALADAGAIGFKIFTTLPPSHRLAEFEGLSAVSEDAIYRALEAIRPTGRLIVFHAENQPLIDLFASRSTSEVPSRPPVIEAVQIAAIAALSCDVGTPVHIAHVTSRAGLDAVRAARAAGAPLTAETCPQYLLFTREVIDRVGAFAKVAPPLRTEQDAQALWAGLADGTLSVLASDHSPFRSEEKQAVPFAEAPSGMPSVETMLPVLLDAALHGIMPLERAIDLVTAAPARLFGLYPRKGTLAVGADADVVLFDAEAPTEVRTEKLVSRAAECGVAYEGMVLQGRIQTTIVNGQIAFDRGLLMDAPIGRFVEAHSNVESRGVPAS